MTEKDKLYADELRNKALADYERLDHAINELERQICDTPRNNIAESSQDCISRQEALKYSHIEYDDDGVGHRVIYAEDIEKLPPVTPSYNSINTELKPCEDVLDEIITQIEQMRDKDKIAEYPYNRCIRIIEEAKNKDV